MPLVESSDNPFRASFGKLLIAGRVRLDREEPLPGWDSRHHHLYVLTPVAVTALRAARSRAPPT
jgi:hypothetical protein